MASPVGHTLLGLAVGRASGTGSPAGDPAPETSPAGRHRLMLAATAIVAALAPDLDFLPGLLTGDPNRFHQLYSHSIGAMLVFGLACAALARWRSGDVPVWRYALAGTIGFGSHLVMDFFTHDPRAPFGIPIFWPLSAEHFTSPVSIFRGILHGVPGDPLIVILENVFSVQNVIAVGIEVAAVAPVFLAVEMVRRRN